MVVILFILPFRVNSLFQVRKVVKITLNRNSNNFNNICGWICKSN